MSQDYTSDFRTSNALGVPIPVWIIKQMEKRSSELKLENQSSNAQITNNLLFRANKTAWVRLVSSVDLESTTISINETTGEITATKNTGNIKHFDNIVGDIKSPSDLAKKFVLYGGVSKYKELTSNKRSFGYDLRGGLGESYNLTGKPSEIEKYGYKPMPGLTSVKIETQGKLGSVRAATIQFKVWNKQQLDIVDALYFKLGYSMFLEWGQTYYFKSSDNELRSSEDLSIDPFEERLTKEDIQNKIAYNVRISEGNYDAMLGMVTNFNFTYTQDGGYDCTLKLISLGVLLSNMKVNNPRVLPELQQQVVAQLYNRLIELRKQELERERLLREQESNDPNKQEYYPPCIRNKVKLTVIATTANGNLSEKRLPGKNSAYKGEVNGVSYFFYRSNVDANSGEYQTSGYSSRGSWYCEGDQLYIDNKNVDFFYKTYEEILTNSKIESVTAPFNETNQLRVLNNQNQLNLKVGIENIKQDYVNYIYQPGSGNYYYAFNKYKALVPWNPSKYKVNVTIKLPKLTIQKFTLQPNGETIETSALVDTSKEILTISSNTDVRFLDNAIDVNSTNLTYTQLTIPNDDAVGLGTDDFRSRITYVSRVFTNNFELHRFGIVLRYDSVTDYGDSGIKRRYATYKGSESLIFQEKLRQALTDPNEIWQLDSITRVPIAQPTRTTTINNNIPKFTARLSKVITVALKNKNQVTRQDPSGRDETILLDIDTKYSFRVTLETDDLGIITSINVPKNSDLQRASDTIDQAAEQEAQNQQQIDQVEEPQPEVPLSEIQKSETAKYKSALEVMIRTLQLYSLDRSIVAGIETDRIVKEIKLLDKTEFEQFTKTLFSNGVFSDMLGPSSEEGTLAYYGNNPNRAESICNDYDEVIKKGSKFSEDNAMKVRALFGFHFGLMGSKVFASELLKNNYHVNYYELMRTYVVPYAYNSGIIEGTQLNHPVYLPLGLVIMIINHACTIYEDKKPLVYFDFNPKTNICLSTPKHLSTNPYDVLIPFQGSNQDFVDILEPTTIEKGSIKPLSGSISPSVYTPLNPQEGDTVAKDRISAALPKFKYVDTTQDNYRGRTMNVLVSCDYLLKILNTFANNNGSSDVYAKEFIEQILFDINKSLGDVNIFRLAYNDNANVAHVVDDQFTPNLEEKYPSVNQSSTDPSNRTRLPLFGIGSIARNLEIRTEVASRLSNMIAISANSTVSSQANLSKSSDSFGFYNLGYKDRYIPTRTEFGGDTISLPTQTMIRSTIQFNEAIKTFYGSANPASEAVGHATNYYIQRMSKIKTEDKATRASAMIPVSLNFTVDGMAGLTMGQSYTIDNDYLPYSYDLARLTEFGYKDQVNTVAFVTVGLDHSIESNQWTTNVRSNMIYAKSLQDFIVGVDTKPNNNLVASSLIQNSSELSYNIGTVSISDINLSNNWERIAFDFITKEEGFIERPKPDEGNLRAGYGTDKIVLANGIIKKVGSDTIFTRDDANRTLTYQIKNEFSKTVINQIGQEKWNSLNDRQKAALVSFAYNVGSLTSNLRQALKSNSATIVANAIADGPTRGKKTGTVYTALQKRRKKEATLYLA